MKKMILLLFVLFSTPVWATDCANGAGTEIIGNNNTHYCMSKITVNWLTAFSWCESQGMHLASVQEACPNDKMARYSTCSNLQKVDGVVDTAAWLSNIVVTTLRYFVKFSENSSLEFGLYADRLRALCLP